MNASVYLRALTSLLERLGRSELTYSACVHELSSLLTLVQDTLSTGRCLLQPGAGLQLLWRSSEPRSWCLPNADKIYTIKLLKKCILTKFQILCVTKIAHTDRESDLHPALREFAEASELLNTKAVNILPPETYMTHHSPSNRCIMSPNLTQILFEDFVETFVSCRSEWVSDLILESSEAREILDTVRQEALFIKSLVSTFNAHSSLLHRLCVHHEDTYSTTPSQDTHRVSPSRSTTNHFLDETMLKRIEILISSELWKEIALQLQYRISYSSQQHIIDIAKSASQQLKKEKGIIIHILSKILHMCV